MTGWYLDSSVAMHVVFGTASAREWFDDASGSDDLLVSSRLLRTELTRALRREAIPVEQRDAILDYVATVPLTDAVLAEAEAMVPHVKTLDAIHLASVIATGLDLLVVTHDAQMKAVAKVLGYAVLDPIGEL